MTTMLVVVNLFALLCLPTLKTSDGYRLLLQTIGGPNLTMTADGETVIFSNYSMTVIDNENSGASSMAIQGSVDGTGTVNINPALTTHDGSLEYPTMRLQAR